MNKHGQIIDEYISRNALVKVIESELKVESNFISGNEYIAKGLRSALNDIERQQTANVEPVDRWVDARKNPPPIIDRRSMTSESVLILRDNGRCAVAYYCFDATDGNYWTTEDEKTMYEWEEVTHWQPLPGLPKDDEVEGHIEVSKPDGNCLDCKFQYLDDSDYWCSICPGNPEDI